MHWRNYLSCYLLKLTQAVAQLTPFSTYVDNQSYTIQGAQLKRALLFPHAFLPGPVGMQHPSFQLMNGSRHQTAAQHSAKGKRNG